LYYCGCLPQSLHQNGWILVSQRSAWSTKLDEPEQKHVQVDVESNNRQGSSTAEGIQPAKIPAVDISCLLCLICILPVIYDHTILFVVCATPGTDRAISYIKNNQ
jgi:hypothetical protein